MDDEIRKLVTEQYADGLAFERPHIVCDLIQATARTVKHINSYLCLSETFIHNYFKVEGILNSFDLQNYMFSQFEGNVNELLDIFEIPSTCDDFMIACVTRNASLSLMVYLLRKLTTVDDRKRFLSNFMNWCSQLRPQSVPIDVRSLLISNCDLRFSDDESKVLLLWFKVLTISESLIDNEENSLELMQSIQRFCKNLFDVVEDTVYHGFLSFMRSQKKVFSERSVPMRAKTTRAYHLFVVPTDALY